jgi:hypothetical protein
MDRREILTFIAAGGAFAASPASACRSPRPKDQRGYVRVIEALFGGWWRRDYKAFSEHFRHVDLTKAFDGRPIFEAYFDQRQPRHIGGMLFNGSSCTVQILTPRGPDAEHGICGGHAWGDLVLIKFYPGTEEPVVAEVRYIDGDSLAPAEWHSARSQSR